MEKVKGKKLFFRGPKSGRIKLVAAMVILMHCILLGRLAYIQLGSGAGRGKSLAESAARRWDASFSAEEYQRGELLDRQGESLTDSRIASRLVVFPANLNLDAIRQAGLEQDLLEALDLDSLETLKAGKSWQIYYQLEDQRFLRRVEEAYIPGLSVLPVKLRYGPDSLARHLAGYMVKAEAKGIFGLEKDYNELLQGQEPELVIGGVRDAWGKMLQGLVTPQEPSQDVSRRDIVTTVHAGLQKAAEQAADAYMSKGAAVVLSIDTAEVLASVSRPNFDQNRISQYLNGGDQLIDRATARRFYPGSVFKVMTAAAALEAGLIGDLSSYTYNCQGSYGFSGGQAIGCVSRHGTVDFRQALSVSCNGYFISLLQKEGGAAAMAGLCDAFGLKRFFNEQATPMLMANTSIGQQGIMVSPLEMARIYACIGRGGLDLEPVSVMFAVDQDGTRTPLVKNRRRNRVLSTETAALLQDALRSAAKSGTAKSGRPKDSSAAAKTGTAQAGADGRVIAWYCGYLPAEKPRYAVAVMVEADLQGQVKGLAGGREAAAVFKQIAEYLVSEMDAAGQGV
ncbi:MAG: penicillin-binding protein 2 [Peptococcaceae bacterium]|nr:penicillin-binding protein 2 [Peptococcaceae bacterium]